MGIVSEDDTLDVQVGASKQALKGAMKRMGNNKCPKEKFFNTSLRRLHDGYIF